MPEAWHLTGRLFLGVSRRNHLARQNLKGGQFNVPQGVQARRQNVARARENSPFSKASGRFDGTKGAKPKRGEIGSAPGGKWS